MVIWKLLFQDKIPFLVLSQSCSCEVQSNLLVQLCSQLLCEGDFRVWTEGKCKNKLRNEQIHKDRTMNKFWLLEDVDYLKIKHEPGISSITYRPKMWNTGNVTLVVWPYWDSLHFHLDNWPFQRLIGRTACPWAMPTVYICH